LLGARNPELGHAAESKLQAEKFDAHFVGLDLTNPQTISLAASKVQREFSRLDVLVNNAGIVDSHDGPPCLASIDDRGASDAHELSGATGVRVEERRNYDEFGQPWMHGYGLE
jgi:NAD(P)-dependent dehydrogenase (short-subunit alcohol dehydrogenase family)